MDKENIFGLFDEEETPVSSGIEIDVDKSINSIREKSFFKIGMFTKLILNHQLFQKKLTEFVKVEGSDIDPDSTKDVANSAVFNRAWSYIKDIDTQDKNIIDALKKFNIKTFNTSIQQSIWFFEYKEEYEKCAHLLKIQNIAKLLKK